MRLAFAPSTRATYKAGITKFRQFCLHHKMPALPADKETVVYFAVAMSRSLSPATIKVYLSTISTRHQQNGYKSPTSHNPILRWILKGSRKRYAHMHNNRPIRQPITVRVLKHVLKKLRAPTCHLCDHDKKMLAATFTLAFFGLLRVSEFTVPSKQSFDPRRHASIASIRWRRKHFTFTINSSKTDQFHYGQAVYITKSDSSICPVAAMRQYVRSCGSNRNAPLFTFKTGEPLTRHSCLLHLRNLLAAAGYQPHTFNTHIFRTSPQQLKQEFQHHKSSFWDAGAALPTNATYAQSRKVSDQQPAAWQNSHLINKYYPKTCYTYVIVIHSTTLI